EPRWAEDPNLGHRYTAACAAALAGCGQGKDADTLDDQGRAALRRRALGWLRAELAQLSKPAGKDPSRGRARLRQALPHWPRDSDLAGVRGELAGLPEAERPAWRQLWADVEQTLARARDNRAPREKTANKP